MSVYPYVANLRLPVFHLELNLPGESITENYFVAPASVIEFNIQCYWRDPVIVPPDDGILVSIDSGKDRIRRKSV